MAADDERDGVALTSLDAPLGDGLGVTKGDLVDYLDAVADRLVPQLAGRPLSVMRVRPGQPPFMQRNVSKGAPEWVRTVAVWSWGAHREVHQVLCDDRRTLLWLGNQRAVEYHVPFFRAGAEAEPTGLVIDLDPPEGADFAVVVQAAELVRRALDGSGLAGAVKTSGSKGVHVVVPVRGAGPEDVAAATRALATRAERLDPELATTAYIKEDRHGRVFLDSTRSGAGTIVAAYSPRIRPGLPVSTPVSWEELPTVRPGGVTVTSAARLGDDDTWAAVLPGPQELPPDLVAEGHTIPVARVQAMHEGKRRKRAAEKEQGG
jgi:bifunctional non-homologous end joining protein LigD